VAQLNLVRTKNLPILEQLQLEEALLRADNQNWCIINEGTPPAIVLGSSSKVEEHLTPNSLPWIRRFSGGGVVVVNESTLFFTLICQSDLLPIAPFPKPVLEYVGGLLKSALPEIEIVENDYTWKERKVAGNAQYFMKGRWLHHCSLLWDYLPEQMQLLKMPKRIPAYRNSRDHDSFLIALHKIVPEKETFLHLILEELKNHYTLQFTSLSSAQQMLTKEHRRTTQLLTKKS